MKKLLACLAVAALLCSLAGCGLFEGEPTPTADNTTEIAVEVTATEASTIKPGAQGYDFTSFCAATPEYFYAIVSRKDYNTWEGALYRAPIDNIARQEEIPLPKVHEGKVLSRPKICGVSYEWVFVCLAKEEPNFEGWVIYCISHDTGIVSFMGECRSPAWYNAKSKCLLLPQHGKLEALHPDTEMRSVIYEAEDFWVNEVSDGWYTLKDGTIALESSSEEGLVYLHIDAANQVKKDPEIDYVILYAPRRRDPETEMEKSLAESRKVITYKPCNGWLYFVELRDDVENLYRMKPGGAGKELLRAGTHIYRLIEINGKLFALAAYQSADDYGESGEIMLHELSADGKPLWSKPCTEAWRFGDMILASEMFVSDSDGCQEHFFLLYDPATNQFFECTK